MRAVLVKPCWPYPISPDDHTYNKIYPPLSLLNCAALLERDGVDVELIDAHAERLCPATVAGRAAGADVAFVTSSSLERWQCPNTEIGPIIETARAVSEAVSATYVTGYHGTIWPEAVLRETGARGVVRGEPEMTVRDIAAAGGSDGVPGVSFLRDGEFVSNPDRQPLDLSLLPVPAFHLLKKDLYVYELMGRDFLMLEISRGCPYGCTFCSKALYGPGVRVKPVENVLREIEEAVVRHGARNIFFHDLEFAQARPVLEELCGAIVRRGYRFRWQCLARAELLDAEILGKMRRAGCALIGYGTESGSPSVLRGIRKEATREEIAAGVRRAREAGIRTLCFFMFGFDGETPAEMEETIRYACELDPDFASFHIASPYPDTEFFRRLGLPREPLKIWSYNPQFVRADLERVARRAFIRFYMRPRHLWKVILRAKFSLLGKQLKLFLGFLKLRLLR